MKKFLVIITLLTTFSSQAALFTQREVLQEFKGHENFEAIVSLNVKLNSRDIKMCPSTDLLATCLKMTSGQKYMLFFDDYRTEKMQYTISPDGSTPIATGTVTLDALAEIALFSFIARLTEEASNRSELEIEKAIKNGEIKRDFATASTTVQTDTFSTNNLYDDSLFSVTANAQPNGCGTPSHWSYDWIPNKPFQSACDNHDICYASYTSKSACDSMFREHMINIADEIVPLDSLTPTIGLEINAYVALLALADAYYLAVKNLSTALAAYCAGKIDEAKCLETAGEEAGYDPSTGDITLPDGTVISGGSGGGGTPYIPGSGGLGCMITEYHSVCTGGGCNYWTTYRHCS